MQPVMNVEACAREIVNGACRGDRCVVTPSWGGVTTWLMTFCPEVIERCYWFLYMSREGGSPSGAWTKKMLDATGARALLFPSSILTTQLKTD